MIPKTAAAQTRFLQNPDAVSASPYPQYLHAALPPADADRAAAEIATWPGYAPTPLHCLDDFAAAANIGAVYYKDESGRFGLGSFKAPGGGYAVFRLLAGAVQNKTGKTPSAASLAAGAHLELTKNITAAAATDGNHGRAVAWGAKLFGCKCRIYIHAGVSEGRRRAMESFGAEVVRIRGDYDESLRRVVLDAEKNNWHVVSDTVLGGDEETPRRVMAGYCLLIDETLRQMPAPPSHVFVQGGVGGLAAAACARLWQKLGPRRPQITVVEPDLAPCLYESARRRRPVKITIRQETMMAGLSCGEPSTLAWKILQPGARNFMQVPDAAVAPLMRALARRTPPVEGGESAVAGLAGLLAADNAARQAMGLNSESSALVFGTEGATDPEIYAKLTAPE